MAADTNVINGHTCTFKNSIPDYCICQRCNHVAREPHLTSCCGDHFCKDCISPYQLEKQPCPTCGEVDFDHMLNKRENKKILSLEVYCSMKSRGCEWTGKLEQLEGHMELESGDCTYVDIQCPSGCGLSVQKRSVGSHLAEECPLRDYTCKYCNFKASFKAVTEDHLPECLYYPITCPNRCGMSFEREVLEDHMKICCMEQLECCFTYAGCQGMFLREDEDRHMQEKSKEHLSLMAATTLKMSVMLDKVAAENEESKKKLLKQEAELKDLKEEMEIKDRKLDKLKTENQKKLLKQEAELKNIEKEMDKKLDHLKTENEKIMSKFYRREGELNDLQFDMQQFDMKFTGKFSNIENNVAELQYNTGHSHIIPVTFTMPYFDRLKLNDEVWYSSTLHTELNGYAFIIAVLPNGMEVGCGTHVSVCYKALPGFNDDELLWPSKRNITIQLLNQHADENHVTKNVSIERTGIDGTSRAFIIDYKFISHNELGWNDAEKTQYLKNNCLKFKVLEC